MRDVFSRIGEKQLRYLVAPVDSSRKLHYGLHFFAHLFIGHADHGNVRNHWVHDHGVFDLLWIYVDAAADDHEGRAIR